MKKDSRDTVRKTNIEKTLRAITMSKEAPKWTVAFFALLYIVANIITIKVAPSKEILIIGEARMPFASFAGVFSSIANISVIFMVVLYNKVGFIVALVLMSLQFPKLFFDVFFRNTPSSLPGLFLNILTIVSIILIYFKNIKAEKYQKKIRDQAVTDMLTKLPNRFAGTELVERLVKQGRKFAVVSIDLNNFKSINETMGQNTGNGVLTEVAARWKNIAETGASGTVDFIARHGGDEFSLIIRGYYSDEELLKTIKCYEAALDGKITIDECDFYITASIGYTEFPTDANTGDALFSCAETAMQEVKRANSSDHILRFTPDMLKTEHIVEIERKIRDALEKDTIFFNLQPQFDMSHDLRGFEALARMKDADGKIISPGEFIPVAEKVGLIDKVDIAVFRKSAAFFGELIKKTGMNITLSVNVSVRHLMKNGFLKEVREIIDSSGVPANRIEIEITESIMIDSYEKAFNCINEIKKMGIKIAIDDFGTGFSSLSYLHKFPADLLKIDKSFIDKMNTDDSSKQFVASIISIGHIMGFDVISEGVEEKTQLDTLHEIGCDFIQGYIWGRPLPAEDAEKLVTEQARK
ncbi:MAG: EAL domain-containing protein [Ruminiclostridium sp.]|nr:EAL domain-containing protein [Ruminiclostridium sp.]